MLAITVIHGAVRMTQEVSALTKGNAKSHIQQVGDKVGFALPALRVPDHWACLHHVAISQPPCNWQNLNVLILSPRGDFLSLPEAGSSGFSVGVARVDGKGGC